jgi:hypothetical protein
MRAASTPAAQGAPGRAWGSARRCGRRAGPESPAEQAGRRPDKRWSRVAGGAGRAAGVQGGPESPAAPPGAFGAVPFNGPQMWSATSSDRIERPFKSAEGDGRIGLSHASGGLAATAASTERLTASGRSGGRGAAPAPQRGQSRGSRPHTVHRASAGHPPGGGESPRTEPEYLDVVVASGRIPQDVVFLGLDCPSLGGVHSAGRPGPDRTRKAPQRPRREAEAAGKGTKLEEDRHSARRYRHDHSDRQIEHRTSPKPRQTARQPGRGRKAGGRREVGRPADASSQGDRPLSSSEGFWGAQRWEGPPHRIAATHKATKSPPRRPPQQTKR